MTPSRFAQKAKGKVLCARQGFVSHMCRRLRLLKAVSPVQSPEMPIVIFKTGDAYARFM